MVISGFNHQRRNGFKKFMFLQVKQGCKVLTNTDNLVASVNGSYRKNITCYNCQNPGHYSNECLYVEAKSSSGGVNLLMRAVLLTQNDPSVGEINPSWVLLDTCSTASVSGNPNLVSNIRPCDPDDGIHIATNGGGMEYDSIADLDLFPVPVHYNPDSIATILALKDVASIPGCYLTMDTRVARQIVVCFEEKGDVYTFNECADGLYYYDTDAHADCNPTSNEAVNPYLFLQTVENNKLPFSKKEIDNADKARELQQRLGFPGTTTLISYLRRNLLSNTNVTSDDVIRGDTIYGPLPQLIKGKCTDSNYPYSVPSTASPVSPSILQHCSNLALFADYFFVNGQTFLLTNTEKLKFLAVTPCERTGGAEAISILNSVVQLHEHRGFTSTTVHGDNDFKTKKLSEGLPSLAFFSCAADQHVGHAERPIRSVKE